MKRIVLRVSLAACLLTSVAPVVSGQKSHRPVARPLAHGTTASLPLFFEANRGQTDARVRFLSRSSGYTLFLTPSEITLVESKTVAGSGRKLAESTEQPKALPAVIRMKLVGGNASPELKGVEELPGKVNYLIGNDPSSWQIGVPLYSQVRAERVYPGVDLVFQGDDQDLEYDFVVAPGADPNRIAFRIAGAARSELDDNGDLMLHTNSSQIRMRKPVIYQAVGGERRPVAGDFAMRADGEVRFRVGQYDARRPLVIDPGITWASFLGGAGSDNGFGLALDTTTNANKPKMYVPGITTDITTFPEPNTLIGTKPGGTFYEFLAKIDPLLTGVSSLDYLTFIGGTTTFGGKTGCMTFGLGVDLDTSLGPSSVEPVISGITNCKDFPVTTTTPTSGPDDMFVTRLMPSGATLDLSIFFGGNGQEFAGGGTVDSSGNVMLASYTTSTNLPVSAGAYATKLNNGAAGYEDCFVAKLSRSFVVQYLTYLNVGAGSVSGDSNSLGCSAFEDPSGQILAGGETVSATAFAAAGGANGFQTTFQGTADAFLMKLDPTKNGTAALTYSSYFGGGGITALGGGAILGTGVVAVVGNTTSSAAVNPPDIPLKNAYLTTNLASASSDKGIGFFAVVDSTKTGSASLISSSYFGGSGGDDKVQGLAYDAVTGSKTYRLVMTGQTTSTNFPKKNPLQSTLTGAQNGWVSIVNAPTLATGPAAALAFSTYIGGNYATFGPQGTNEAVQGVRVDGAHTIYARGRTLSDTFFGNTSPATTVSGFQPKCSSCSPTHASPADDAVVFRLPNPTAVATTTTLTSSPNPSAFGQSVTFTATVKASAGTPTGKVTFKDGTTVLGSGTLSLGVAKFTTASLKVGVHSITAVYGGSINFFPSTSAALSQTVNKATTTTSLTSSPNPSTVGQTVKFTATVKATTSGTPTGTVTFKDGTTKLGSSALSGGTATFSTSSLTKGNHSITAVYGGSGSYLGSTSPVLTQTVN